MGERVLMLAVAGPVLRPVHPFPFLFPRTLIWLYHRSSFNYPLEMPRVYRDEPLPMPKTYTCLRKSVLWARPTHPTTRVACW